MTPRPEKHTPPTPPHPRPAALEPDGGRGTKSDGRQAVLSALRPAPHSTSHPHHTADDPTPDRPGIRIFAPPVYRHHYDGARWSTRYSAPPTAAYACACGQTGAARGEQAVADLICAYEDHKAACTGTPAPHTERRVAA